MAVGHIRIVVLKLVFGALLSASHIAPGSASGGSVRHPGLDNHAMGTIFEELVRRLGPFSLMAWTTTLQHSPYGLKSTPKPYSME
jgi:hypothetical protein